MMTAQALQAFLHDQIPLTRAMDLAVRERSPQRLVLAVPLAPNVNDKGTLFGGSSAALATLACWGLLTSRCRDEDVAADIVVASSNMTYLKPASDGCEARCAFADEQDWPALLERYAQRGRAKLALHCELTSGGELCARFDGQFALLSRD